MTTFEAPGVVAILRLRYLPAPDEVFEALVEGGIRSIEVTLPTPDSLLTIGRWHATGAATVGAGTIRTSSDVDQAASAGAQFLVTPTTNTAVLEAARAVNLPVVCGALTPSEIDAAARGGASLIKVFPIDALGGLAYLKAISAPLADIRFVPTGGVDVAAANRYAAFGCAGVGVGSALVDEVTVAAREWSIIRDRAAHFVDAWRTGVLDRG